MMFFFLLVFGYCSRYSSISVIRVNVSLSRLCFSLTSAALLYAFLMWVYNVVHESSTSLRDVESLPRFFCSFGVSIAFSPT